MLNQLVPLINELQVKTNWDVITVGNDFFEVTKAFSSPGRSELISCSSTAGISHPALISYLESGIVRVELR